MKLCWFALRWLRISRILSSFWSVCCFKSESDTFVYPAIWKWTYADSVKPILKLNFEPGWRFNLPKINGDFDQIFSSNCQMHFFFFFLSNELGAIPKEQTWTWEYHIIWPIQIFLCHVCFVFVCWLFLQKQKGNRY